MGGQGSKSKNGNGGPKPAKPAKKPSKGTKKVEKKLEPWQIALGEAKKRVDAKNSNFSGLYLGKGTEFVGEFLQATQFTECNLSQNGFTTALCEKLVPFLPPTIKILDLSKNELTGDSIPSTLAKYAKEKLPNLEVLLISSNPMGTKGMEALAKCTTFLTIDASCITKGSASVSDFCKGNVKNLSLFWNKLGASSIEKLMKALPESKIENLDIGGNDLGDESAEAIAKAIATSKTLTSLNLSHNRLTQAGAKVILAACEKTSLQKINFSYNSFISDDIKEFIPKNIACISDPKKTSLVFQSKAIIQQDEPAKPATATATTTTAPTTATTTTTSSSTANAETSEKK